MNAEALAAPEAQVAPTYSVTATRTPPYVSFKTFLTLLDDLKTVGIPSRIDRSALTRFAGGLGGQLLSALRSLGLMDDGDQPTDSLETLVNALGTDRFREQLREVIDRSYPFLAGIDLTTATPSLFAEAFKNAVDAKEDVLRKCRTFYLHAAQAAGIPVGQRLGATPPRSGTSNPARRKRRANRPEPVAMPSVTEQPAREPAAPVKALEYQLIDLMSEPDVDDTVKGSIWALVQYLMARKAKKAAAPSEAAAP